MSPTFWLIITVGLLGFLVGIAVGIPIGTYSVIDHVARGFSGSTIMINLNETSLVNEINKTFYPQMKQILEQRLGK